MDNYIERAITPSFLNSLNQNKVLVLMGTRRVGKTMFLNKLIENKTKTDFLMLNGEEMAVKEILKERNIENYKRLIGKSKYVIIDEAQNIVDIGWVLKLMVDTIKGVTFIATGSSSFDLNNKTGEPLTGRKKTFYLFPFAQSEFASVENLVQTKANLENRMIYGCYPELIHFESNNEKELYLKELINSYLLKDILVLDGIKNASKIFNLLKLLAFQVGNLVSLEELGKQLGMSKNTVGKYLDLLSKVFIIFNLSGFNRNLRSEISKSKKWYFYDNGIRNVIINNFNPVAFRNDIGQLWENYIISERMKYQANNKLSVNNYFWRTYQQQEIDWIEERDGNLCACEFKWNTTKKTKTPTQWKHNYPDSSFQVITPDNYLSWIDPL